VEGHLIGAVAATLTLFTLALVCRRRSCSVNAIRWILAVGAGAATFALGLLAGLHNCDQGVPIRLAGLFGCLVFVAVGLISPKRLCLPWSGALLFFGISLCYCAANLYHDERFTGNRQFTSGMYWHTFFTGVYERKVGEGGFPPNLMKSPSPSKKSLTVA
jgi:hypothetical protein